MCLDRDAKALYSTYHIIQRGNNRQVIFKSDDRFYYLELLRKANKNTNSYFMPIV